MENSNFYWNEFMKSGKISDYLQYRQTLSLETSNEPLPTEELYASQYRRTGCKGKDCGRE